jgi:hypothetical protein
LRTAQAGARGGRDVALFHTSCTDKIKSSLQFSCNFYVINTPRATLSQDFITTETFYTDFATSYKCFLTNEGITNKIANMPFGKLKDQILFYD